MFGRIGNQKGARLSDFGDAFLHGKLESLADHRAARSSLAARTVLAATGLPGLLPSMRSMAAELRISRLSVSNAYEQLLSGGYLETFVGSGTCVARTIPNEAFDPTRAGERVGAHGVVAKSACRRVSARASAAVWPANPENW